MQGIKNKFKYSPEVWKDQPYDLKSDTWSLGCLLFEIISLKPPLRAENMEGLYNKVIKGKNLLNNLTRKEKKNFMQQFRVSPLRNQKTSTISSISYSRQRRQAKGDGDAHVPELHEERFKKENKKRREDAAANSSQEDYKQMTQHY